MGSEVVLFDRTLRKLIAGHSASSRYGYGMITLTTWWISACLAQQSCPLFGRHKQSHQPCPLVWICCAQGYHGPQNVPERGSNAAMTNEVDVPFFTPFWWPAGLPWQWGVKKQAANKYCHKDLPKIAGSKCLNVPPVGVFPVWKWDCHIARMWTCPALL